MITQDVAVKSLDTSVSNLLNGDIFNKNHVLLMALQA